MKKWIGCLLLLLLFLPAFVYGEGSINKLINERYSYFEKIYYDLHQHPELAHQEKNTAKQMADELKLLGFEVTTDVGGHGVVGVLKNGKGHTILVRTDMDALPIQEETKLSYRSLNSGVMHACGHDVHMTTFLGTAYALTELKDQWHGTLVMIAQPAEEVGEGARGMIEAGLFKRFPRPDYILSLHVSGSKPVGALTYKKGYSLANVDYVDVSVYGRGGHGATPHKTVDPIVLASDIILNLQTLISREMDPSHSAVVSVGSIHGGTKHNIIPDEVKLQMTVRSHEYEVRQHLKTGIKRIIENMAMSARAPKPKVVYHEGVPSLYNDPDLVEKLIPVFEEVVGKKNVFTTEKEMYGEDFAYYGYKTGIPIFQFGLGAQRGGEDNWPQPHSSKFAPEFEKAFKIGVETMTKAVVRLQNDL